MTEDLAPLDPRTATQMYLDERSHELADATLQSHRYRLKQFVQWCGNEDIDNLNELSSRDIHHFRVKRCNEDGLRTSSMKGQFATLRMFLRFAASIDAVQTGLDEKILLPTTTPGNARDEPLEASYTVSTRSFRASFICLNPASTLLPIRRLMNPTRTPRNVSA